MSTARLGVIVGAVLWHWGCSASAAELKVHVSDPKGRPVPEVVVIAVPQGPTVANPPTANPGTDKPVTGVKTPGPAVMDQQNRRFVPGILVVRTGTPITFPNSDSVSHQVYSFSPAKRFQLPLYRGQMHPPLMFDKPGLVVVGCNIHDSMIGYIYVTDATQFGKTNAKGSLTLSGLIEGRYNVTLWNPRLNEPQPHIERQFEVQAAPAALEIKLTRALQPDPTTQGAHDEHY